MAGRCATVVACASGPFFQFSSVFRGVRESRRPGADGERLAFVAVRRREVGKSSAVAHLLADGRVSQTRYARPLVSARSCESLELFNRSARHCILTPLCCPQTGLVAVFLSSHSMVIDRISSAEFRLPPLFETVFYSNFNSACPLRNFKRAFLGEQLGNREKKRERERERERTSAEKRIGKRGTRFFSLSLYLCVCVYVCVCVCVKLRLRKDELIVLQ